MEAQLRRSTRKCVTQYVSGNDVAERSSPAKRRRREPKYCIVPNLLVPSGRQAESLHEARMLPPKTAPLVRQEDGTMSSKGSQECCHADAAANNSVLDNDDDHAHGCRVYLARMDPDGLDSLSEQPDRCSSSMPITDPACRLDVVPIEVCNTFKQEPEGPNIVLDGEHADTSRSSIIVPSLEVALSATETSLAPCEVHIDYPGSTEVPSFQKKEPIMIPEAPEQRSHDTTAVEDPGFQLKVQSGHKTAALLVSFFDIAPPPSSSARNRGQFLAIQDDPIPANGITTLVGYTDGDSNAKLTYPDPELVYEGNIQDSESTSTYGKLLELSGIQDMCMIKPTVFEEQYTTYRRSTDGEEVEGQTTHRYEGHSPNTQSAASHVPDLTLPHLTQPYLIFSSPDDCALLGNLRPQELNCTQSGLAFIPDSEIINHAHPNWSQRSQERESLSLFFHVNTHLISHPPLLLLLLCTAGFFSSSPQSAAFTASAGRRSFDIISTVCVS